MKQNSIVDYLSCILFKAASFFTLLLPLNFSLFLGRRLGDLIYLFDRKHRVVAYANIRRALADKLNCRQCLSIARKAYQAFGQNLAEISFIGRINKQYLEKYIHFENKGNIDAAFKRGKGVIFLAMHEGNWELSNIICANLGFPFVLFVRDQGLLPRLNALLNSYRLKQGAKIIHKQARGQWFGSLQPKPQTGLRQLIEALISNQAIGMTVDQGGKAGQTVQFFNKEASMSVGAVKLALKYDCAIVPVFYTRINGPHTKVILDQVFTVTRTANPGNDLRENLQRLINIYEQYIRQYPHEYLWTYKIWKYGRQRNILILSDGKAGHLRQSEGVARLINQQLSGRSIKTNLFIKEVKFRSRPAKFIFNLATILSGKYQCSGCLACMRYALTKESWQELISLRPDIIISAGNAISSLNYLLARENQAKSICLMRPGNLSLHKFDLAIIPEHDQPAGNGLASFSQSHQPAGNGLASFSQSHGVAKKNNVVITEGALNLIGVDYLSQKSKRLEESGLLKGSLLNPCIGILIGGNSRKFSLGPETITKLAAQIKKSAEELNASVLISTSRRSSPEIQKQVKDEFADYARCKLLVIANENNNPDVAGGILGLSNIVISSPESISMISESVEAKKYVLVFKDKALSRKHQRFLKNYQDKGYIYLKQIDELSGSINQVWKIRPKIKSTQDNLKVIEGLGKII